MATNEYQLTVNSDSATVTSSPQTGDVTNAQTTVIVKAQTSIQAKIQYSSTGGPVDSDWDDYTASGDTSPWYAVNATSVSKQVNLSKYLRVDVQNLVAGEVDTVSITLRARSDTPQYAQAADVARLLHWRLPDGSRYVFTDTTVPSLQEINEQILEAEDYIDDLTGHAWRSRLVDEYYDYSPDRYIRLDTYPIDERYIELRHRQIRPMISGTHKIELFQGSSYTDIVATGTEGRVNDWWVDGPKGNVYFTGQYPTRVRNAVHIVYEYGDTSVPRDIQRACALIVASNVAINDDAASVMPQGSDHTVGSLKYDKFMQEAHRIIQHYQKIRWA